MGTLYGKFKWAYQKFRVSYSLPFIVLISYTLAGAIVFRNVELEEDKKLRQQYRNYTEFAFNRAVERIMAMESVKINGTDGFDLKKQLVKESLFWFIDFLNLTQVIEERSAPSPWTWMGSAMYAGQLYTTIGYGYPLVKTQSGKILTIFYIMIGIPIFLIILKDVGKLLSRAFRKIYKRWRAARKKLPEKAASSRSKSSGTSKTLQNISLANDLPTPGSFTNDPSSFEKRNSLADNTSNDITSISKSDKKQLIDDDITLVIEDQKKSVDQVSLGGSGAFPIPLAFTILLLWILLSAALFCVWETEWGYLTSVYFFFVSISTVGLGDIVPSKPDMMIFNFMLILIGLALLSMCINLLQETIERMLEQLLQEYLAEIEKMATIMAQESNRSPISESLQFLDTHEVMLEHAQVVEEESWPTVINRRVMNWVAQKFVDTVIVKQFDDSEGDSSAEDSDDEDKDAIDRQTPSSMAHHNFIGSVDMGSISKASVATNKKRPKLLRRRGNFTLNFSMKTLKAAQAMEKARTMAKNDGNFKDRIFARAINSKKFTKFIDSHAVDPSTAMTQGIVIGEPVATAFTDNEGIRLVTPESSVDSQSSTATTVSMYDVDSLYSLAYHDLTFGYSTESVAKLIEAEVRQQQEEKIRLARQKKRRQGLPPLPPSRNHSGTTTPRPIIKVSRTSASPPETTPPKGFLVPPELIKRRNSSPVIQPAFLPKTTMTRCPSCQHFSEDAEATAQLSRVQSLVGLLPTDFSKSQSSKPLSEASQATRRSFKGRSPSLVPSNIADSGYYGNGTLDV